MVEVFYFVSLMINVLRMDNQITVLNSFFLKLMTEPLTICLKTILFQKYKSINKGMIDFI